MTVDVLSSIKGAKPSAAVNQLFEVIKQATITNTNTLSTNNTPVLLHDLREDIVIESTKIEKQLIKENFPKEKNGYLVVTKVIDTE